MNADNLTVVPIELRRAIEPKLKPLFDEICKKLKAEHAFIAYIDEDIGDPSKYCFSIQRGLWLKGNHGALLLNIHQGISGWAVEKGDIVVYPEDEGSKERYYDVNKDITSEIAVPFLCDEKIAGIILLDRAIPINHFSHDDRVSLSVFAIAIKNHLEIAQRTEKILDSIASQCLIETKSLRGYIALKGFDGRLTYFKFGDQVEKFLPLSPTEGLCGRVFQTGLPVNSGNVLVEPDYVPSDPNIRSECIYPIKLRKTLTVAILNMESTVPEYYDANREAIIRRAASLAEDHVSDVYDIKDTPDIDYFYGLWDFLEFMIYLLNRSSRGQMAEMRTLLIDRLCSAANFITKNSECVFWDISDNAPPPRIFDSPAFNPHTASNDDGDFPAASKNLNVVYASLNVDGVRQGFLGVVVQPEIINETKARLHRLLNVVSTSFKRRRLQTQHQDFLTVARSLVQSNGNWASIQTMVDRMPAILECAHCTLFYQRNQIDDNMYAGPTSSPSELVIQAHSSPFYSATQISDLIPKALRTGETVNIASVHTGLAVSEELRFEGRILEQDISSVRSVLVVPVINESKVLGVLRVFRDTNSKRSGFDHQDVSILETIAGIISPILAKSLKLT